MWKRDDNLEELGILLTNNTKKIKLGKVTETFDIYKIPLDLLKYNAKNGRIFMEMQALKAEGDIDIEKLEKNDIIEFNNQIENLIWESDTGKNQDTLNHIKKYGQLDDGVVLENGIVVDGNRRFTCLRKLHAQFPNDDRFKFFSAAIIFRDESKITDRDITAYELNVQFGQDEKAGYKIINTYMRIYNLVKEGWALQDIADNMNRTLTEITKIVQTAELVEEFLKYIQHPNELIIAESLHVYNPLEKLRDYLRSKSTKLTDIEKIKRKNMFFDYLLTTHLPLPTQEFQTNLIKKIFKNQDEFNDLYNEYIKNDVNVVKSSIIEGKRTPSEFVDNVKSFRETNDAKKIMNRYKKKIEQIDVRNQIDTPVDQADYILDQVKQINLVPFLNSAETSSLAESKLKTIYFSLNESNKIIESLLKNIKNKINIDE